MNSEKKTAGPLVRFSRGRNRSTGEPQLYYIRGLNDQVVRFVADEGDEIQPYQVYEVVENEVLFTSPTGHFRIIKVLGVAIPRRFRVDRFLKTRGEKKVKHQRQQRANRASRKAALRGALPVETTASQEVRQVHVLYHGLPLCGFSTSVPSEWPEGHVWAYINDLLIVTCDGCKDEAKKMTVES